MTLYLSYKLKGLITTRSALFWGIIFILFWVLMWIYVFTQITEPYPQEVLREMLNINAALAYSYLGALSMGSVSIASQSAYSHHRVQWPMLPGSRSLHLPDI
jgi:hypothetical protein